MKYFEVGQTVFCWDEDNGVIEGLVTEIINDDTFPIRVDFKGVNLSYSFTHEGRRFLEDPISLFQTKPIITPNAPIFEERPAYFYHDGSRVWFYDILIKIDELGSGNAKVDGCWYPKWQYEAPTL